LKLHIRDTRLFLIIVFSTALGACAVSPTTPPVVEDAGAPIEREPSTSDDTGDAAAAGRMTEATRPTAATASLLAAAQTASEERNFADAISYLERAVRIEPRNATLWIELSDAHLANGNTNAADQHVRKAIALAGADAALTRLAWLQLADVREAEGNLSEARAIRRRYAGLRG
jgi:Flp pilus assembly protein TadD